jgi:hypothetical protein
MHSFKTFLFLSFLALASAFVPSPCFTSQIYGTPLSLHPSQAKELEAHAQDHMKKVHQEKMNVVREAQPPKVGPMAWCVGLFIKKEQRQG